MRVITDDEGFAALRPGWGWLTARQPGTLVFQRWAWVCAWWAAFGNARPVVAVLGEVAAPLGILALYRFTADDAPRLLPIGVGISDHFDAIVHPDAPPDAASRLLAAALAAGGVDHAELLEVPPGAALRDVLAPPGWRLRWDTAAPCPVLDLRTPTLEDAIPSRAARKWRMNANRCARLGRITVNDEADGLALLAAFNAARRADSVLDDAAVRAMLRHALPDLPTRLCVARIGGEPAAAILAFRDAGRISFYLGGFAERFAAASPGSVLLGTMLREAHAGGVAEAHFLRGDEAYKLAWGAMIRHNRTAILERGAA